MANAIDFRPWRLVRGGPAIEDASGDIVIYAEGGHTEVDASFIIDAVNAHDALVAALEAVRADGGHVHLNDGTWFDVRTALALARGGK